MTIRHVIDTTIASAASDSPTTNQIGSSCREFLLVVRTSKQSIVLSPTLNREWREHRSAFTREWLVSMFAKRLVITLGDQENTELREKLATIKMKEKERENAEKDFFLLELALQTDRCVSSLDETVRSIYKSVAQTMGEIKLIVWVNPTVVDEKCLDWLNDGCPADKHRQLGAQEGNE